MDPTESTTTLSGLSTVTFFAGDHAAAVRWYTDFLGRGPYFTRPGYAEFRLGAQEHELGLVDARYAPAALRAVGSPGGAITYWHVDDVAATVRRAVAAGARELEPVKERGGGFVTASVVDPFGNVLGVMFSPHFLEIARAHGA